VPQKPQPGTVQDAELAAAGKVLYEDGNTTSGVPACEGCHQPDGVGNARYPRIAGQHQTYTILEMTQFKKGTRSNDRSHAMRSTAERMTEREIAAVAEYLAGL
jgi:cytochrome c553